MIQFCHTKEMDGRKLGHGACEEIRIRGVKRVEAGGRPEVVFDALGVHRSAIYKRIAQYRGGGVETLKARKAARPAPKLPGQQLGQLSMIITPNNTLQLVFEFALGTRATIPEVIRDQFGVRVRDVSVGRLLRKLGLSPQRPQRRAYERAEAKAGARRKRTYPEIRRVVKQERASIYSGDEASIRSVTHSGTTWAPKGETPGIETTGARLSIDMVSAVSAQGLLRCTTFKGRMNRKRFIEILKLLTDRATTPISLIRDGRPVHKSKRVGLCGEHRRALAAVYPAAILPASESRRVGLELVEAPQTRQARVAGPDKFRTLVERYLRKLAEAGHPCSGTLCRLKPRVRRSYLFRCERSSPPHLPTQAVL